MVMSYTTLIGSQTTDGSIANWVNHASVQASADTIVSEAESFIYRRLRHFKMLTSTTGSFSLSNQFIAMPSDYLEDKVLYVTGINYQKMTRKTMEEVIASYNYDGSGNPVPGQPLIYFNDQSNLCFESIPDQTYPYLLYYYQQPAPLSSSITNFLTVTYPRLMRCAVMAAACEFMKDNGMGNFDRMYWDQLAETEIQMAQLESDRSQRSIEVGMILT